MNNKFNSDSSPVVFTLTEEQPDVAKPLDDWERDLQALRHNRQYMASASSRSMARFMYDEHDAPEYLADTRAADAPTDVQFDDAGTDLAAQTREQSAGADARQPETMPKQFGDEELDEAYRVYLQQRVAEHNARLTDSVWDEDVGVLMQEDWLQAQSALKTEMARNRAQKMQTLILQPDTMTSEVVENAGQAAEKPRLPEFAVNVYALPDMPASRRVHVLSEQELLHNLRDKLTPHLTNAVAGMVRQILQRKLATLSYELQIQFNEETPQLVQEVLEYNLDSALRTVKHQLREK